jgi:hypothetical protein
LKLQGTRPGTTGGLGGRGGNRLVRGIAEGEEDPFSRVGLAGAKLRQSGMKGRHPEIILTRSARDAVEEGTEVDHFVTGFDIVEIEDFGACQGLVHGLEWVAVFHIHEAWTGNGIGRLELP